MAPSPIACATSFTDLVKKPAYLKYASSPRLNTSAATSQPFRSRGVPLRAIRPAAT